MKRLLCLVALVAGLSACRSDEERGTPTNQAFDWSPRVRIVKTYAIRKGENTRLFLIRATNCSAEYRADELVEMLATAPKRCVLVLEHPASDPDYLGNHTSEMGAFLGSAELAEMFHRIACRNELGLLKASEEAERPDEGVEWFSPSADAD